MNFTTMLDLLRITKHAGVTHELGVSCFALIQIVGATLEYFNTTRSDVEDTPFEVAVSDKQYVGSGVLCLELESLCSNPRFFVFN